ncbi:MAG TPA: AAA family ATPase [Candidatus Limnocylindrales bacterium]|nr:AAA family ATPase [Candidatus Limnocylindrales bacterium]
MARRLVSPTLVGRATELAAVAQALDRAMAGAPVHQLIAGEAGVGKSRLVLELSAMASARGIRVLSGGCADIGDGGVPYGPIVEALRTLARELDEEELDVVVGSSRGELARLVPSLSPTTTVDGSIQTEALQARLLDAILGVLQRLSATGPVMFVVEDLHWADPATRETIGFLIRQLRTDPVLLVLTFRADELHRRHPLLPWLAELGRSGRVERLDLERLDSGQTSELLGAILGAAPPRDLADQIHRRSDGNPFFVEELVMAGEDGVAGRLPPTLRGVLLARIVALPEPAQRVIGVAAVAGRRVDHELLARVAAMDDREFMEALRTAVGSQVLVAASEADDPDGADGDYAFRHALLQEAAYDDLLPGERQRLHRAFAETLAERGPGSGAIAAGHWGELAFHWSAARDDRRAFEASVRAGEAAASGFAFADARRHDERALELWSTIDDPVALAGIDRVGLLDRAAVAAWLTGDTRRSVALRREAVAALAPDADPNVVGTMLERLGRAYWYSGDATPALEAHERAVAIMSSLPPTPERARVLSGYGQILMLHDRWAESRAMCEQAIAMAREVGARQAEGHALTTLGLDLATAGECDAGVAALEEGIAIAREVANADDIGRGYVNIGEAKLYSGDPRGAWESIQEGIRVADEVGVTRTYGQFIRENGVQVGIERGDWDEAQRLAEESIAFEAPGRLQRVNGLSRRVPLLVNRGDERAPQQLAELRSLLDGYAVEMQFNAPYRVASAEASLWSGEPAAALEETQAGIAETVNGQGHWYHRRLFRVGIRAAADLAEIGRARRDRAGEDAAIRAGTDLLATLEPILAEVRARQHGRDADETAAEVATIEAERRRMVGEPAGAAWIAAAERWRGRENPYLVAYCRWRQGEAQLREGDRAAASAALVEAHATAIRLGARPLRAAVEALAARSRLDLSASGTAPAAPVPPAAADDPFGLTRRERDVLPLLVRGRTNRQIAEELFISENTAGVHVSNILGKLGATTRTEAAGIAARLGIGTE